MAKSQQIDHSGLYISRVKVKVVKWCRKKWFDHNLMYIYHKQCEILQKNHRSSSNIQFQWFPIDSLWKGSEKDQNYANANASRRLAKILRGMTKSRSISTVGGSGATSTGNFFELFFQNRWSFYGPVDPKHAKNFKKVKKTPKMHWHHTTQMVMETLVTSG